MTEEVEIIEGEDTLTTEESKATESGWRPEDQWEGEQDQWIDAKTFNMRGELLDRIKSQTSQLRGQDKKIEKLEAGMSQLAEHNKKMDEIAYEEALRDLKNLKKDAMELEDYDQVTEIDDKISDLKVSQTVNTANSQNQPQTAPEVSQEVNQWLTENPWYNTDTALRYATDGIARDILQSYPELKNSPRQVLEKVTSRIKEEFPTKFAKRRNSPQGVSEPGEGKAKAASSSKKYSARNLNSTQLEFGRTFVETGAMKSLDEYAGQLAKMGELDIQKGA